MKNFYVYGEKKKLFQTKKYFNKTFLMEEVSSFDLAHYMTSFDTESLFTNIPVEENINICVEKLFRS